MAGITGTIKGYALGEIVANAAESGDQYVTMPNELFTKSGLIVDSGSYKSLGIELSQKLTPVDPFKDTINKMMNAGPLGKIFGGDGSLTKFASGAVLAGSAASSIIDIANQGESVRYVNFYAASGMEIKSTAGKIAFEFFYGMNDSWNAYEEVWEPSRELFKTLVSCNDGFIRYGMPTQYGWDIAVLLATLDLASNKSFKGMAESVKSAAAGLFKKKWPWSDAKVEDNALQAIADYKKNINMYLFGVGNKDSKVRTFLNNFTVYEVTISLGSSNAFKIAPSACGKISLTYDFSQVDSNGYPLKATVALDALAPILTLNSASPL